MYSLRYPCSTVSGLLRGFQARPAHRVAPCLFPQTYSTRGSANTTANPDEEYPKPTLLSPRQLDLLSKGKWPTDLSAQTICVDTQDKKQRSMVPDMPVIESRGSHYVNWCPEHRLGYIREVYNPMHDVVFDAFFRDISRLTPDLTVRRRAIRHMALSGVHSQAGFLDGNGFNPRVMMITAFSQPRSYLQREVHDLLREGVVRSVIVIHVDEKWHYLNPLRFAHEWPWKLDKRVLDHVHKLIADPAPSKKETLIQLSSLPFDDMRLEYPNDPYSPIWMYDRQWVGEISADVEIWRKDPSPGAEVTVSERQTLFGRKQTQIPNFAIPQSDVAFSPAHVPEDGGQLQFAWDEWRAAVEQGRWQLARHRYRSSLRRVSRFLEIFFKRWKREHLDVTIAKGMPSRALFRAYIQWALEEAAARGMDTRTRHGY